MASLHSLHILLLLIFSLFISISGKHESESGKTQHFHTTISSTGNRKLQNNHLVRKLDESTNPVTNPANFPPYTPTPTIVTVPASNPTTPVDSFPTTPPTTTTVPASTTPTTTTPITNPANPGNNPPIMNPNPPPNQPTSGPISSGSSWCIANSGASETQLQSGLDYACGIGGADCSTIQQGGSCYDPNSLQNHASFAFNSYYQKNPSPQSCDFGGAAVLVNTNPSTGSCVYPTSASGAGTGTGTAMPASTTPPTTVTPSSTFPTPTTTPPGTFGSASGGPASGTFGSPPSLTNPSNNPNSLFPASYGPDSPPSGSTYPSGSAALQPDISFVILVVSFFTGKLLLGV